VQSFEAAGHAALLECAHRCDGKGGSTLVINALVCFRLLAVEARARGKSNIVAEFSPSSQK
jgi:hypothetical protein